MSIGGSHGGPADDAGEPASAPGGIRRDATVFGFDVGSRRIGVAVGSAFGHHARALAVVDVHSHGPDWTALDRLLKEWRPDGLVIGDPMTLDGGNQPARDRAHAFARELQARYRLPAVLVDERSSSIEAAQRFASERAQGRKRRRDAQALDALAAAVIVERWLAAPGDAIDIDRMPPAATPTPTPTPTPGRPA